MKTTLNPFKNAKRTAQGTGGGVSPTVIKEIQAEISVLGSQNKTQAQDITDIKGSLNSINDNLEDEIATIVNNLGAKNMLPNNATTRTINGITFTVNNDGSIGTSGTSTDGVGDFIIGQITPQQSGEYILSGCNGGTDNTYFFSFDDGITAYKQYNDEIRLNLVGGTTYTLRLWIATSGVDMSNKTFYPMVRPASIADDTYAPYAQTNKELTDNLAQTPITKGGVTLSTIDDKLNYLVEGALNVVKEVIAIICHYESSNSRVVRGLTVNNIENDTAYANFQSSNVITFTSEYLEISLSSSSATLTVSIKVIKPCYITYKRTTTGGGSSEQTVSAQNYAVNDYVRNEQVHLGTNTADYFSFLVEEPRT